MAVDAPIRRIADPEATDTVPLPGPCSCPGQPHERDTATFRTELGGGERLSFGIAGFGESDGSYFDWEAAESQMLATAVVSWTLQDKNGDPLPINFTSMHRRLDRASRKAIATAVNDAHKDQIAAEAKQLPNASGARSRGSSRASASPNPTIRPKRR